MFVPKEVMLNLAMRSSRVRERARRHHNTGVMADPERGRSVLEHFMADIPLPVAGLRILELGPGQGIQLAAAATAAGASYAAFDIEEYLDAGSVEALAIDYRVDASGHMPWDPASFDVVWSHSVLEHLRDPMGLLDQVADLLAPGGHHVASIDLETHLGGREDPQRMYEFLRYPDWLWRLMTSNRSSYVNGLRLSDWREAMLDSGLQMVSERTTEAACGLQPLRRVRYLSHLSDEDLLTKHVTLTAKKPDGPPT